MTAVMLVLIWSGGGMFDGTAARNTTVSTPALYFSSFEACEDAIDAIEAQVKDLNPNAQVSARCYEEAEDPRG